MVPRVVIGGLCVALCGGQAVANDRTVRWGTQPATQSSQSQSSVTNHLFDSQTAVIVSGGGDTLLPGATVNSIGVLNQISVVGDDNLIEATQTGENSGDVTTTITIGD